MKNETKSKPGRACVSYVTDGAIVLSEAELSQRGETLLYRLSVEPRTFLRKGDGTVFYTVTVERLSGDERTSATLRDFSSERRDADAFYRRLISEGVTPEGLSLLCEGE